MALTVLTSAAEVLVATGHDPYARGSLRQPQVIGWAGHGAVAWRATDAEEGISYLMSLGEPAAVSLLVEELLPELRDRTRVTLPRGTAALLPAWVALAGTDWDFRWLDAAPPQQPGEDRVTPVEDAAVADLLERASPRASARPGDPAVKAWYGITGPGSPGPGSTGPGTARPGTAPGLLACAADTSAATAVGHLSSIAVDPDARGQGLGAAVTAAVARRMLATDCDLVTLGMYADNTAGRALYDRLGMHDAHHFTSGPLQIRSRW